MNLWPIEHFFEPICHHFWVGLLLQPTKSDNEYAQKNVQLVRGSSFRSDFLQNPYFNKLASSAERSEEAMENWSSQLYCN